MKKQEQRAAQVPEPVRTVQAASLRMPLTVVEVEEVYTERMTMLSSLDRFLSPLMRRAIQIKLVNEREFLTACIPDTTSVVQKEEPARVLDPRHFKRRWLPKHSR